MPLKTVRQHSRPLDAQTMQTLTDMAVAYRSVKNYVYSRYSGIRSIVLVNHKGRCRREIRDEWSAKHTNFASQWPLPARIRNLAIEDALGGIRSEYSNTMRRLKLAIKASETLDEDTKTALLETVRHDRLVQQVLVERRLGRPKKTASLVVDEHHAVNWLCRRYRRLRGHVPHTDSLYFRVDGCLYSYTHGEDGNSVMGAASMRRGQRLTLPLTDRLEHRGILRVVVEPATSTVEIQSTLNVSAKPLGADGKNVIGIDKGVTDLLMCSTGNAYGHPGTLMARESDRQTAKLKRRNRVWRQAKRCEQAGDMAKAERIRRNNMGRAKWTRQTCKAKARITSDMNHAIRLMLHSEKPSAIVLEQLNFQNMKRELPKNVRRKLAYWMKGVLDDRLEYVASLYGVDVVHVNAAYTSQQCAQCKCLGERTGKRFSCPHCGHKDDADRNASLVILSRADDPRLFTPYKTLRKEIEDYTKEYNRLHKAA